MRAVALAAVLLALAGCGGGDNSPSEDPGEFVRALVQKLYAGETGRAWETLHPLHKTTVPRARYVECERLAPLPGEMRRVEVVRVFKEPWAVPGDPTEVESTAVTIRLTLKLPATPKPGPVEHTAHVFDVDGKWAWVIGPGDYARYAAGSCPAATPT